MSIIKSSSMLDASPRKVEKLIKLMERLIACLGKCDDLRIHRHVDEFYYLQKKEEFLILMEEGNSRGKEVAKTNERLQLLYNEVVKNWLTDVRWMKKNAA
jgi:hypothetical protein